MNSDYHSPLLASVFRGIGWLNLLAAAFLVFVACQFSPHRANSLVFWSDNRNPAAQFGLAFLPGGAALLGALLCFGAGQVIDSVGQIAHHTRQFCEKVDQLLPKPLAIPPGAIPIPPLGVARENGADGGADHTNPARHATTLSPQKKRFFYQINEAVLGPADKAELQRLIDRGEIGHDTPIRAEGASDWRRLEDLAKS